MPRAPRQPARTSVESFGHVEDSRSNIPTVEGAESFFDEAAARVEPLRYERDPSRDPQLVWRGKGLEALEVDAPPIYIQEKIEPRALVANLRRSAPPSGDEPSLFDFDDFDGLDELDAIDYYQHEASWSNRMILGDSLQVMGSLAERESLRGKVQMVYIDPPYGIKFGSNWQVRTGQRDVKDGKLADAAREAEQIKAFRDTWKDGIHTYLAYLRDRLVVARDLLTESGSVFVQIGDENVHLVRSLLDEVFGEKNFVSQIAYRTTTGATSSQLAGTFDYVIWFARSKELVKFRRLYTSRDYREDSNYRSVEIDGNVERVTTQHLRDWGATPPPHARLFRQNPLTSQSGSETTRFPVHLGGHVFLPGAGGWKTNEAGMARLRDAGRLLHSGRTLGFKRYFEDFPFEAISNSWDDTRQSGFGESKVYVVQTATRVIERCMLMTTDPGDLVLDPTCGSGTTALVAEQWGRRWITIDTSRVAIALARQRLMGAKLPSLVLRDSEEGRRLEGLPAASTDGDLHQGFVYERVQHITLRSIANNPDIREGMSREEIDAAIRRHADYELLVDRPKEHRGRVRVTGRFTVESLSPHRSLRFEDGDEPRSERDAASDPQGVTFEQSILDNLRRSGIQNGAKAGRFTFASLDAHAGAYVQAIGERRAAETDDDDAPTTRVAVAIGPQYGTVSGGFVKESLKEARRIAPAIDTLYVLGFAFDPKVEGSRELAGVRLEVVRMNADLLMVDALKKTGSGNLFTVFGEPDIAVRELANGQVEVEILGVDVFNPNTGAVRSSGPDGIALWMIDTAYDGESFFVRRAYFTGEKDPFQSLRRALKAEIDQDAWDELYRHVSQPFPRPETGRIAVKVINDYGDEVMKVYEV